MTEERGQKGIDQKRKNDKQQPGNAFKIQLPPVNQLISQYPGPNEDRRLNNEQDPKNESHRINGTEVKQVIYGTHPKP